MTPNDLKTVIEDAWSEETCAQWQPDNPAFGQGNVTALVVHDIFGGEIVKTEAPIGWHFYNIVDGLRYDLASGQFLEPLGYSDDPSSREEALAGIEEKYYLALKAKLKEVLG